MSEKLQMRIIPSCAECLYSKQQRLTDDEEYLAEIREMLENRKPEDCSPYMVYKFNQVYRRRFGERQPYASIKKKFNDLVLAMEDAIRRDIETAEDPLAKSILYARVGNYIDFGAMISVDEKTFLSMVDEVDLSSLDEEVIASFIQECSKAKKFLLLADNCGEIVYDKLMIEQLKKRFPQLEVSVMVRGGEILNDATIEDAEYVGIDQVARVVSNGEAIAGTVYEMLTDEAKQAVDEADVILSKGQGNYESFSGQGWHVFYSFLCKCELFTTKFQVPKLTGMFVEEK